MTDLAPGAAPAAPANKPVPDPVPPAPATIQSTVEAWVSQHLHNSPISRATDAWNHLQTALPDLIAKLKEL